VTNPDIVTCSYPPDSVGMVRPAKVGFKPKMIGGAMVGLRARRSRSSSVRCSMAGPFRYLAAGSKGSSQGWAMMKKYQLRASVEGADVLGYYIGPWGYAQLEVLQQAVTATKSLSDDKLADYIRANTFKTVVGDVKFGKDGEWAQSRVLQVQFQNVKGNDVGQFKDISTQVVVMPAEYRSGKDLPLRKVSKPLVPSPRNQAPR
jgi:branched-chain amino acid transport system substrate-binding protein